MMTYFLCKTFDEIKGRHFDGMVVTGAPVEPLEFEDVDYLNKLLEIQKNYPER